MSDANVRIPEEAKDRLAAINTAPTVKSPAALLSPAEWAALKRICAGS